MSLAETFAPNGFSPPALNTSRGGQMETTRS